MKPKSKKNNQVAWQDIMPRIIHPKSKRKAMSYFSSLLKNKSRRFKIMLLMSVLVIVLAGVTAYIVLYMKPAAKMTTNNPVTTSLPKGKPSYSTILPSSKKTPSFGGWTKISPPGTDPVFAYADIIDGVSISVSEQPIPDDFKPNVAESVKKLALDFGVTKTVRMNDIDIYIGSYDSGLQRVILVKSSLLILMSSNSNLSDDQWIRYIDSLQ